MGFKEVMALRQQGNFEEALTQARTDYAGGADQWTASALFWVLKDLASQLIDNGQTSEAAEHVDEMGKLIREMGATAAMAQDTLTSLQQLTIPHNKDLRDLLQGIKSEKNKYKEREKAIAAFHTTVEWDSEKPLHPELHATLAEIILRFLDHKGNYIAIEEYNVASSLYFRLQLHSSNPDMKILEHTLRAKALYGKQVSVISFLDHWDLRKLTEKEWKAKGNKNINRELIDRLIAAVGRELVECYMGQAIPDTVQLLRELTAEQMPTSHFTQLLEARILLATGANSEAYDLYREVLHHTTEASAWAEFEMLVDDPDLKQSILAKCLKEEHDDYAEFLDMTHFKLAQQLCRNQMYPNALRELKVLEQLAGEKSRPLPEGFEELKAQIPSETEQDRENRTFYIHAARLAEETIFDDVPEVEMVVVDVIAVKVSKPMKQVVPMLKMKSVDGRTALVSPKESGVKPGNNRGELYTVRLLEKDAKHNKVMLMTPSEHKLREVFPTQIGYITGYSQEMHAFHVIDNHNTHLYLPEQENTFSVGEFVSYVRFTEHITQYNDKGKTGTLIREMLIAPERIDPYDAVATYPIVRAVVAQVQDSTAYIVTDDGIQGAFNTSISPLDLAPGDLCALRGFVFKRKDKMTGDTISTFVTLAMEPLPPDAL